MNGYTLANHFRKLRPSFSFSSQEADLFYELVALCNDRGWPTEFQYPNHLLCATLHPMVESTLVRARNRLKQAGLLEFTSGHKRNPTVYRLLDPDAAQIPLPETSKSASTNVGISEGVSNRESDGCIYKEKTKRKTKPPAAAGGGGVQGSESSPARPTTPPAWQVWLSANAPEVQRLKTPLTAEQWQSLVTDFGEPLVQEVLLAMQNHAGLTKKYVSANLTARDWCKRRQPAEPAAPPLRRPAAPPDPEPALNYDFLAEQQAREQEDLDRQNADWQARHAVAA